MSEGTPQEELRRRLYESYATTHSGIDDGLAATLFFRRDICPHLPADRSAVIVDIGCGQGNLVRQLTRHGYLCAKGIDISAEQVEIAHRSGVPQVQHGDFMQLLRDAPESLHAVLATDLLEHLTKDEVLVALDAVHDALRPGGVLVARTPNAVSPLGGNYRHGDFTHETWFTPRSMRQICRAVGFRQVEVLPCEPPVHGLHSGIRLLLWKAISGAIKLALATETGVLRGNIVTQNFVVVAHKGIDSSVGHSGTGASGTGATGLP